MCRRDCCDKPAGIPQVIEEQIRVAVVVEIDPGTSLAAAFWLALHAGPGGDFLERAVSLVVIETVFLSLASDEQVDPAVVIIIAPACGDGIDGGEQSGLLGDVAEAPITVISQERGPHRPVDPGSARNENIQPAVIVVVGLITDHATKLAGHIRLRRAVFESPIPPGCGRKPWTAWNRTT